MTSFVQIKTIHPFPGVGLDYPRPEDTPGVFIEHFDFSPPYGDGRNGIIYGGLFEAAKETAASSGWGFRSYSVVESPGTDADWSARQIRQFPTLILFRDGVELGRHTAVFNTVPGILFWANKLLGIECEAPDPVPIPAFLRDRCHITPSGMVLRKEESTIQASETAGFEHSNATKAMNDDPQPDSTALREEIEQGFVSGTALEVVYFGGGLPGARRLLTPLRYCEMRGRGYIIALCKRTGIEKTFRLDRMHLPSPPLADGRNDLQIIAKCLGKPGFIEGMLAQIARLDNLPIERALAAHFEERREFESFFDEYPYGGYTLELQINSAAIFLNLGFEANDTALMHYEFTPESEPRLTPGIATHYTLYLERPERQLD